MTKTIQNSPDIDERLIALGTNIRRLREEKGLSLSELAEKARISKSTLSSLESGKTNPTISTLWAIADALDISFGELIGLREMWIEEEGVTVQLIEQLDDIEIYLMKLDAKSIRNARPHPQGVKEHVLVVKGSILIGNVDSPKLVDAVGMASFMGDQPHIYITMEEPAYLIIVLDYRGK